MAALNRAALIALAASLTLALGSAPAAASVACGDVITKNAKLMGDLVCSTNPALTVAGGGRLDMRGFTVECDENSNDGIVLVGRGAKLTNGTVSGGCRNGVVLLGMGKHHVSEVRSEGHSDAGFQVRSDDNRLVKNEAVDNREDGFYIDERSGNQLVQNEAVENREDGFFLRNANGNRLVNNLADRNEDEGICLGGGEGNHIVSNESRDNTNDGIELDSADGNNLNANWVHGNGTSGLDIDGDDNNVSGNWAHDNGSDGIEVFGEGNDRLRSL